MRKDTITDVYGFSTRAAMFHGTSLLVGLLLLIFSLQPAWAQDGEATDTTFTVTVVEKTDEHPHQGQGSPFGYAIDGTQGKELTLERGTTYLFLMDEVPSFHPFYISTSEVGASQGVFTTGVSSTNNEHDDQAWASDTLFFALGPNVPDTLYYQCYVHQYMGYRISVVEQTDTAIPGQLATEVPENFKLYGNYPNPFNPTTTVRFALPRAAEVRVEIYTPLGQVVKTIRGGMMPAGAQSLQVDGSNLASGMYLYRVVATVGEATYLGVGKMVLVK